MIQTYLKSILEDRELSPVSLACEGVIGVLQTLGLSTLQLPFAQVSDAATILLFCIPSSYRVYVCM